MTFESKPVTMTDQITVETINVFASDQSVADAARVSTLGSVKNPQRPIGGLISSLMRDRHGSPFEHNSFTFRLHIPLDVATEHLRHRAGWSYNGASGRFMEFEPVFYCAPRERPLQQVGKAMDYDMRPGEYQQVVMVEAGERRIAQEAYDEYRRRLELGIARERARTVLPQSLMTTYYTTCNARSLMAFLALRTSDAGKSKPLWEIEQVAKGYEEALREAMPLTHTAFVLAGRVAP